MQASRYAAGRGLGPQRVLMLALCSYPSPLGTAVCIRALAHALVAYGHSVDVVTYASQGEAGVLQDGPTTYHAVPQACIAPHSGPQRAKWRADRRLWHYALQLGQTQTFDVLYGHHIEGICVGRALQSMVKLPLIGHMHTRLGLELSSYLTRIGPRAACAAAGALADRALPRMVDALVTLNATDAAVCRRYAPSGSVFVRYPQAHGFGSATSRHSPDDSAVRPRGDYAIYSGNADAYQNLALLCDAARQYAWPLVIATHGPTTPFGAYRWPDSTKIVRVESFAQMLAWLRGARVGVCPRVQPCGYPIKWLNYWQAGLTLVATTAVGKAVFGSILDTAAHGPALWARPRPKAFGQAILQTMAQAKPDAWVPTDAAATFDDIFVAAKRRYLSKIF